MTAQIVSLKLPLRWSRDWSQQELAEFYRVESALIQAGLSLETERGLSDEGDPWFAFCRSDNGEVFVHFARIDSEYVIDGGPFEQVVRGPNFPALVRELIGRQPLAQARARGKSNIFFHPAALLIALVGGAFFHSGEAKATETTGEHHPRQDLRRQLVLILSGSSETTAASAIDATQAAAILTGVMIGLNQQGVLRAPVLSFSEPASSGSNLIAPQPPLFAPDNRASQTNTSTAVAAPQTPALEETGLPGPPHVLAITPPKDAPAQDSPAPNAMAGFTSAPVIAPHHDLIPVQQVLSVAAPSTGQIELAALGGTDAIQAIQLVQDIVHINPNDAPRLLKLPDTLTNVIGHGEHVGSTSSSTGSATTQNGGSTTSLGDSSAAPSGTGAATSSIPSPFSTLLNPNDPAVSAAVAHFINEIQTTDVVVSGHDIVIYDGAIMNARIITPLESITFHFTDGSSLSLVGTVVEIYALHYGA